MSSSGNWDQNFLFDNLPNNIAEKVLSLPAPSSGDGLHIIGWGGTNTRQFSVKSAYDMKDGNHANTKGDWKSLWNWKGPYRTQTFILVGCS